MHSLNHQLLCVSIDFLSSWFNYFLKVHSFEKSFLFLSMDFLSSLFNYFLKSSYSVHIYNFIHSIKFKMKEEIQFWWENKMLKVRRAGLEPAICGSRAGYSSPTYPTALPLSYLQTKILRKNNCENFRWNDCNTSDTTTH